VTTSNTILGGPVGGPIYVTSDNSQVSVIGPMYVTEAPGTAAATPRIFQIRNAGVSLHPATSPTYKVYGT
jgi:hypothetical protein